MPVLFSPPSLQAPATAAAWPLPVKRLMAADAAFYAPPDLKRQLVKHRDRLMAGVTDATAEDPNTRTVAEHRAAAARGAKALAQKIRGMGPFEDVSYDVGVLVHECALSFRPTSTEGLAAVARSSSFLGFPSDPFQSPEALVGQPLPSGTPREAYDSGITLATRLLAWVWKTAGGNAKDAKAYPASKGPYVVR